MTMDHHNRIVMGKLGAPHGVRGAIKLFSYTENPEDIFHYHLQCAKAGGDISLTMQSAASDFYIVKIAGVHTREQAAELTHGLLTVERKDLPDIKEGHVYYQADLVGLDVRDAHSDALIGTVCAAHNFGAGDILEIKPTIKGATFMIPFNDETVPSVDVNERVLRICVTEDEADENEA